MSADQDQQRRSRPRCGYVFDRGTTIGSEREACCWRETWGDDDRCKWHLDADKSDTFSTPLLVNESDYLSETVLRGASLASETALAGRVLTEVDLSGADLRHADLSGADLSDADLREADLSHANLTETSLHNADFTDASLRDADLSDADARGASFERADLENAALTRANLRNATIEDARLYQAGFSDTWINDGTVLGDRCVYEKESTPVERDARTINRDEAAAWTYRALMFLCRNNALPDKSRWYHVREKDARRKTAWLTNDYARALKAEASRWVMEYGSNPWRIVGTSAVLILVCALLYPLTGGIQDTAGSAAITYTLTEPTEAPLSFLSFVYLKSLYFSVVTFTTLGYGDIQPIGTYARVLATVEAVLGSLLIALLVFVLSRSATW